MKGLNEQFHGGRKMANILYISFDGMTEPLGQSQVLEYLLDLSNNNNISLFSYEKPIYQQGIATVQAIAKQKAIAWHYLPYSNRFGLFSTVKQILLGLFLMSRIVKAKKVTMIHARSLIPGLMGLLLKKRYKCHLLFDIRGFAIDEKIINGRLKDNSIITKLLKKLEAAVYNQADHIVTLTHASKPVIENKYGIIANKITVIPTCTNAKKFKQLPVSHRQTFKKSLGYDADDIIILHNGSLNNWVDFTAELSLFKEMSQLNAKVKLLILNKSQHSDVLKQIDLINIEKSSYKILSAELDEVNQYLNIADVCIFFIKPSFAKMASAPTKFAELVAAHLPCVANTHYGDVEYYLKQYKVGMALNLHEVHNDPKEAAITVLKFMDTFKHNKLAVDRDFEQLLSKHFSKDLAVLRYQQIYDAQTTLQKA
jgi:glycosyltransferase involved in cell wall biosynthesis